MVFTLKPPPQPLRRYASTKQLRLETGLSYGLSLMASGWKVPMQPRDADTIRLIQEAMIAYNIKAGSMPECFTVQAKVWIEMRLDPELSNKKNRAKFSELMSAVKLPCLDIRKPRIEHGEVRTWFWSTGFPRGWPIGSIFLDEHKVLEIENIQTAYPDVFPKLPEGLEYGFCDLKQGGWRG